MHGRISMDTAGAVSTVVKRAEGTAPRSRLSYEAGILAAVTHPGIIRFVEYRAGDHEDELITEFAGAATLADHRPGSVAGVAGLGAAIADTVADLHDMGVAHGSLQADHVVLGARRRPVLCSLSSASYDEPARIQDVVAVGELVAELLRAAPHSRAGAERRTRALVAEAAADAAAGSCTARELAVRLAAVPGASIETDEPDAGVEPSVHIDPDLAGTRTWRHRVTSADIASAAPSRKTLLAAGLFLIVVVLVLVVASGFQRRSDVEERLLGSATPSPSVAAQPTATDVPRPPPAATGCRQGLDVDGDGCADDTEVVGRLIRHGDIWYEVGEPGDVVVLGHWSCAPIATPAVLRPTTGELFVFDRWPSSDGSVTVVSSMTGLAGASSLVLGETDGCDSPVVDAS